ncbi:MAG: hypothetical protein AAFX99_10150 [Myxococcota bacterium]
MTKVKIIERDLGWRAIRKRLSGGGAGVEVGIFDPEQASKAVFNEYGTSDIPERSFLRATFDAQRPAMVRQLAKGASQVMEGKATLEQVLDGVGADLVEDIKRTIANMSSPPNAPGTINQKGANDPLVDTGAMMAAVEHKVDP